MGNIPKTTIFVSAAWHRNKQPFAALNNFDVMDGKVVIYRDSMRRNRVLIPFRAQKSD